MEGTSSPLALLIVACCLQLRVRAYDNGEPARSAVVVVTISVERNLRCPRWQEESKTLELLETTGVDELLYTLRATDSDRLVSASRLMPARQAHFPLVHSQLVRHSFHSSRPRFARQAHFSLCYVQQFRYYCYIRCTSHDDVHHLSGAA